MKILNIIATIAFLIFVKDSYSQTTVLDFTRTPQTYAGDGTYNPNYFDNSGCSNKFGPNPLPVSGHNVRSIGASNIFPVYTNTYTAYLWSLAAFGNTETGQRCNVGISVEYPFKANRTYLIELYGVNDHVADGHNGSPKTVYNGVFWVKLDDNPALITNAPNPCKEWYAAMEKSVGRYSKLIADPIIAIENKTYRVKFSPLESKSALKIFFDSSPIDPKIIIDNIFDLKNIKIVEMPYEEDGPRYYASYSNVPRPPRGTPGYDITSINDPSNTPTNSGRSTYSDFTIAPNQWILDYNGLGYSVYLKDIIPNFNFSTLINVIVKGDTYTNPRTGQVSNENIILPGSYQNNHYEYQLINGEVVISVKNVANTSPSIPVNGQITYYQ